MPTAKSGASRKKDGRSQSDLGYSSVGSPVRAPDPSRVEEQDLSMAEAAATLDILKSGFGAPSFASSSSSGPASASTSSSSKGHTSRGHSQSDPSFGPLMQAQAGPSSVLPKSNQRRGDARLYANVPSSSSQSSLTTPVTAYSQDSSLSTPTEEAVFSSDGPPTKAMASLGIESSSDSIPHQMTAQHNPSQSGLGSLALSATSPSDPRMLDRLSRAGQRMYDYGKNSSRVVKYGAEIVENGIGRVTSQFGNTHSPSTSSEATLPRSSHSHDNTPTAPPTLSNESYHRQREYFPPMASPSLQSRQALYTSPGQDAIDDAHAGALIPTEQGIARSTWGSMLAEAGATAGGIGAAFSEESMKSLKFCIQWLQYATAHIDHQIGLLRALLVSLDTQIPNAASKDALVPAGNIHRLSEIKRDVVDTIRRVVDIISKYAGAALPDPAKRSVRLFILNLPGKWAAANQRSQALTSSSNSNGQIRETQTSSLTDGSSSENVLSMGETEEQATRLLGLATESLDMLRGVMGIFSDSIDRAEAWIERLRVVGYHARQQAQANRERHAANGPSANYAVTSDPLSLGPMSPLTPTSPAILSLSNSSTGASSSASPRHQGMSMGMTLDRHMSLSANPYQQAAIPTRDWSLPPLGSTQHQAGNKRKAGEGHHSGPAFPGPLHLEQPNHATKSKPGFMHSGLPAPRLGSTQGSSSSFAGNIDPTTGHGMTPTDIGPASPSVYAGRLTSTNVAEDGEMAAAVRKRRPNHSRQNGKGSGSRGDGVQMGLNGHYHRPSEAVLPGENGTFTMEVE